MLPDDSDSVVNRVMNVDMCQLHIGFNCCSSRLGSFGFIFDFNGKLEGNGLFVLPFLSV